MGRPYYRKGLLERILFPGRRQQSTTGCCGCAAFAVLLFFLFIIASVSVEGNRPTNSQRPLSGNGSSLGTTQNGNGAASQLTLGPTATLPAEETPSESPTDTPALPIDYSRYVTERNPGIVLRGPSGALGSTTAPSPPVAPIHLLVPRTSATSPQYSSKRPAMATDVVAPKTVKVSGYDKQNGTHVGPYTRSAPSH